MKRFLLGLAFTVGFVSLADAQFIRRRVTIAPAAPAVLAAPAAPADAGAITDGHRLLYEQARIRAVGQLARKKNISRSDAKEMIDDAAPDEVLHKLASKAGLKFKGLPTAGGVAAFIQWLIDHQDQILALVKIIMALFGVDADSAFEVAVAIVWQNC